MSGHRPGSGPGGRDGGWTAGDDTATLHDRDGPRDEPTLTGVDDLPWRRSAAPTVELTGPPGGGGGSVGGVLTLLALTLALVSALVAGYGWWARGVATDRVVAAIEACGPCCADVSADSPR